MKRLLPFLFVLVGFAANAQWTQLSGPPGGDVTDIERTSSGKLYAVLSQTLYESLDNGSTWQKTTITTPTTNFQLDDLMIGSDGKLYALNYSTIYTSTDGSNWTTLSSGQFYGMYNIMEYGPDKFLAVSGWNGVYISKNSGTTWTQILTDNVGVGNNTRIASNAAGDLFVPTQSALKRHLYPGISGSYSSAGWTSIYSNANGFYNLTVGIDNSNNIYASVWFYNGVQTIADIIRSTNNGTSWTPIPRTGIQEPFFYYGFWARTGTTLFYINTSEGKIYSNTATSFATTNYSITGATVTNGSAYVSATSTASIKVGDRVTGTGIPANTFVTQILSPTEFYIFPSATATSSAVTLTGSTLTTQWTSVVSPSAQYGSQIRAVAFASTSNYFLGTSGDGVFATANSGTSFTKGTGFISGNGRQIEVANTTGRLLYINNGSSKGYWTSIDNGATWSFVSLPYYVQKILKLSDGNILLYGDRIYRSTDNGGTFAEISSNYSYIIQQNPSISTKLYSALSNQFQVSTTGGTSWSTLTATGLPASFYPMHLAVTSTDQLYSSLYNSSNGKYQVYKISAGVATLLPNAPWLSDNYFYPTNVFIQGSKLYVATYNAIYSTTDDGATWSTISFSGDFVFPISQGSYTGIAISRSGVLYVTQDDGKSYNSASLPTSNSYVTDLALDLTGKFIASATNSPALKNPGNLLVDPTTLPVFIDFGWQPTNGPYGGEIYDLAVDNSNNVYALSRPQNNFLKANLAVTSWTKLNYPNNYYYFNDVTLKKSSSTLYAIGYGETFTSTNGGSTWTSFNSENIASRERITATANGVVVMVAGGKLYATAANGNTFGAAKYTFTASENFYYWDSELISNSNNVIFCTVIDDSNWKEKIKRSTDNGMTWTDVALPNDFSIRMSADNNGNIYVRNYNGLYKSTDNGTTWTSINGDLTGVDWNSSPKISTSPTGALYTTIRETNGDRLIKSTNGGTNWTKLGLIPKLPSAYSGDALDINWLGTKLIVATRSGVLTSTDDGITLIDASTGITGLPTSDLYLASQSRLLVGVYDQSKTAFKSEDKGATWAKAPYSFSQYFDHPDGSLIGLLSDGSKAYRSIDAGVTWLEYTTFKDFGARQYFTANGTDHYAISYNEIYYSNDLTSWSIINISGIPDNNNRQIQEIAADTNGIGYLIIYNGTTNLSEAYQVLFGSAISLNQVKFPQSVKFYKNKIYLFGSEGTLATTSDGFTWTKKSVPGGYKFIIATKEYYFISQYGGVLWLSRNQGDSWQSVGLNNAQDSRFLDVVVNEYDGYAYAIINNSVVRKSANVVIPDDKTAPIATAYFPANNATNVSVKPTLTLTFDEGVIPQSGKTIRILDVANPNIALETINITSGVQLGKSFSYTLTNYLDFNKQYFVVLDAGSFKDVFGNSYAGILNSTTWRFTTKAAPNLSSITPANNATGVSIKPTLSLAFSEKMGVGAGKTVKIYQASNLTTPVETVNLALASTSEFAQITPSNASPDETVKLVFNAAVGGGELIGESKVYAHLGVVTSSATGIDWTNVVGVWGQDNGVGLMTKVPGETDIWEINLSPTARQYFSVVAGTNMYRLAMVFRNADGTSKAAPPGTISGAFVAPNGDVFIDFGAGSTACSGAVSRNNTVINITPCTTLNYQTNYVVKLDDGAITTVEGKPITGLLTGNNDWAFTTKLSPSPTTLSPANNATAVPLSTPLSITFSEPVTAVTGKNLSIYKSTQPTTAIQTILVTSGSVSGSTMTYALSTLDYQTQYFVKLDDGAFKSQEGISLTFLNTNTSWTFTTIEAPDTQKPTIVFTTSNLEKGAGKTFEITVNDNKNLPTNKTKMFYRKITEPNTVAFISVDMTAGAGSGTVSSKFSIAAQEGWYDAMGLEFYFETEDGAGNKRRSPETTDAYYYSYIDYKSSATYPVLNSELSFGGNLSNYRIVTIPYKLSSTSASTILNEVNGGGVDKTQWRLLTLGASNTYNDATSFTQGKGYWINIRTNPGDIKIEGSSSPEYNKSSFFSMTLNPGWNMIGNPYPVDISWEETRAGSASVGKVKIFSGSTYTDGDVLKPLQGGFVNVTGTSPVNLKVRFKGITTGGRIGQQDIPADLSEKNWFVSITATNNDITNALGGVGMHEKANIGWDEFDDMNPPRFLDAAELAFIKSNVDVKKLAKDFVPTQDEFVWDLNVEAGAGLTTLTWNNADIETNGKELILFDVVRQQLVDMKAEGSYSFNAKEGNTFKVYFGTNLRSKIKPTAITLSKPYPNPTHSETAIVFTLPDTQTSYQTALEVYNSSGQRVNTLAQGNFQSGFYTSTWSGEGQPNGLYFVRLTVLEGGTYKTLTEKVVVNR